MQRLEIPTTKLINFTKLFDALVQIDARVLSMGIRPGFVRIDFDVEPEAVIPPNVIDDLTAVIAAHDPSATPAQADAAALTTAQSIALAQAKVYLRDQLRSGSPNVANIVTTVKNYINGNTVLNTMLSNQIALMNGAFGWNIDLNPATAQARQRYLLAVEMVIALIG